MTAPALAYMLLAMLNNLPPEKTRFVGREQLLAALCELANGEDVRLLTLTGAGGSGKTRLALRAAAELLPRFQAGVFFVRLAAVTDPESVIPTIARTLELKESHSQSALASLQERISDGRVLLLLDNFEQVLDAGPFISDLLQASPHLKVLVTSRAVLHLAAEHEFPVPPLTVPGSGDAGRLEELAENEAVQLFVERARSAHPGFSLTAGNAAAVAEICQRLDGLPLALELAAARLRALPLRALLQRLERRLPLLTGGPRDAPARQQTLRDTIAWSYDLLTGDEQALFRRLATFRGCTLDAIDEVCCAAAEGPRTTTVALPGLALNAVDGVTSLVEKSLLRRVDVEDGHAWYLMLETVREYALEQLNASGNEPVMRRRHALYYLHMVEAADEAMHGPGQVGILNRLEREHNNCRDALRWCTAQGYAEPSLRIAVALWWFWVVRGYAAEGREWLTSLIACFPSHGAIGNRSELRVRALEAAGHLASFQGDFAAARGFHQQNLPVVEEQGDASGLYRTLQNLGFVARQQEDWEAARGYLQRCLAVARQGGDRNEIANALHNLAGLLHDLGDLEQARILLEESVPLFELSGLDRSAAIAHLMLSIVALDQGDYDLARDEARLAIAGQERAGDRRAAVNARTTLANIALAQSDFGTAEHILCEGLRILEEIADPVASAGALERFAALLAARGEPERALRLASAAANLRESNGAQLAQRYQRQLEAELAPARTALGPDRAAAAYQAGSGLTVNQAIREALSSSGESGAACEPDATEPRPVGESQLTRREMEIAALISRGATNRQIADALVIAEGTAANHVLHILNKLGFSSRSQIAVWAVREGLPVTSTSA